MPQVNPALPIVGQSDSSEDPKIVTALSTLIGAVNSVDDAQIAAGAAIQQSKLAAPTDYNTLLIGGGNVSAKAAGNVSLSLIGVATSAMPLVGDAANAAVMSYAAYLDPADFAVTGRAAKYRLRVRFDANSVSPPGSYTITLNPVTAIGSGASGSPQYVSTIGAGVGTVAFGPNPGAGAAIQQTSGDFAAPAAGLYAIAVTNSALMTAGAVVSISWMLQRRTV